jgi:stage III sporulation protein AH
MKNIFKKNSIIITALAIMIVIAGYLSFTNRDASDAIATSGTDVTNEDTQGEGYDVVTDTTGTDTDTTDDNTTTDTDITDTDTTDTDTTDTDTTDDQAAESDADELGSNDISDDDALANAQDVADNGELNLEEGTPGDAVLASATVDAGYFVSKKLEREQTRAKNKDTLMEIIGSTNVTQEEKQDALDAMIELTNITERESAAEMLLEAKGFDGAIVFIVDDKVDVVVNAVSLSDQQLAIIEDVVKNETDIPVANIEIIPTVVSE